MGYPASVVSGLSAVVAELEGLVGEGGGVSGTIRASWSVGVTGGVMGGSVEGSAAVDKLVVGFSRVAGAGVSFDSSGTEADLVV